MLTGPGNHAGITRLTDPCFLRLSTRPCETIRATMLIEAHFVDMDGQPCCLWTAETITEPALCAQCPNLEPGNHAAKGDV